MRYTNVFQCAFIYTGVYIPARLSTDKDIWTAEFWDYEKITHEKVRTRILLARDVHQITIFSPRQPLVEIFSACLLLELYVCQITKDKI